MTSDRKLKVSLYTEFVYDISDDLLEGLELDKASDEEILQYFKEMTSDDLNEWSLNYSDWLDLLTAEFITE